VAKLPSPSFPLHRKQGRRPCGTAAAVRDGGGPIRALWAVAVAGIEGERERELRGIDPLPHLGRR